MEAFYHESWSLTTRIVVGRTDWGRGSFPRMEKRDFRRLLGKRIAAARDELDWKQPALARACGWFNADGTPAQTRVSNYETGTREPGIGEVAEIARATGKPLLYFYDFDNDLFTPASRRKLALSFADLPIEEVLSLLQSLSEKMPRDDLVRAAAMFSAASLRSLEGPKSE